MEEGFEDAEEGLEGEGLGEALEEREEDRVDVILPLAVPLFQLLLLLLLVVGVPPPTPPEAAEGLAPRGVGERAGEMEAPPRGETVGRLGEGE